LTLLLARKGPKGLCRRRRLIISAKQQTVAFNCAFVQRSVCWKKYVANTVLAF